METPKYTKTGGSGSSGDRGGNSGDRGCGGGGRKGVGRPSKGPKPIKVPRRGLGVAQLEKLRLEEEQRNANAIAKASLANSPMHLQATNLGYSIQSSSSNSVPSSTVSFVNNVNGLQLWPHHGSESEKKGDTGFAFASSLAYESNSIRPLPNWVQRTQQQQNPSSSMVSVYSRTSSSTSVQHSSLEPPSNQNYSGSYVSKRREEMMIGFKRPNPFSLDSPPMSSSNSTPLPSPNPMKASETISPWSGRSFNLDFGNSTLREIPSASASNSELTFRKSKKENKSFGDFLTLAPPTQSSHSNIELSPSTSLSLSLHHQGNMVDQVPPRSGHRQFNQQQQSRYNSIPHAENVEQTGQQSSRFQNSNTDEESIDLSLKL